MKKIFGMGSDVNRKEMDDHFGRHKYLSENLTKIKRVHLQSSPSRIKLPPIGKKQSVAPKEKKVKKKKSPKKVK